MRTSTTSSHSCSAFFMQGSNRAANFACRMFDDSFANFTTRSTVRLSTRQPQLSLPRQSITHLSAGESFASDIAAAAIACRQTSTSRAFRSSAIAFENSPMCALYIDGQCFEMYVIHSCAACAVSWARPSGSALPAAKTENDWFAESCDCEYATEDGSKPFCTRLTNVGIED